MAGCRFQRLAELCFFVFNIAHRMSPTQTETLEKVIATLDRIAKSSELSPETKQQIQELVALVKRDLKRKA